MVEFIAKPGFVMIIEFCDLLFVPVVLDYFLSIVLDFELDIIKKQI